MLDYRISTFLVLYDEMNYRRTAEILNMTQPGVTQHIHYLENYYGIKLFEYNGRTLSRTENAKQLKKYFDSIKAEEQTIRKGFITSDMLHVTIGATKTIGEFVITPKVRNFLQKPNCNLDLYVDNTETLLHMLEQSKLDFAIVEGVFDKSKYGYHLYKKEAFVGICAKTHPFANKEVTLDDIFKEKLIVREESSGTRTLLQHAITDRGFSFNSFKQCTTVSNFSVICDLVANTKAITFAYAPISKCRNDLSTFTVKDLLINGEFNFVYCNERIARQRIEAVFDYSNN